MYDIIVVGGGPAGLTAAVYARRAGKTVLVIEKAAFGGQITWSPKVENFPGSVSISGTELGDRLLEQAMEQGAEVELEEIVSISRTDSASYGTEESPDGEQKNIRPNFILMAESGAEYEDSAVIFAAGAKPRTIGLDREEELTGQGVCYCAVCDGAFYRGRPVAVYGGGNSALQDALLLSEKCSRVWLVHRRDSFRGEAMLVKALEARENVEFVMNSTVTGLLGEEELKGIKLLTDGKERSLDVDGLFVAIGHRPDNSLISALAELDGSGYAVADESCGTKTPGLFVAGDCRTKKIRQVTTACADGAVAALSACAYIDGN